MLGGGKLAEQAKAWRELGAEARRGKASLNFSTFWVYIYRSGLANSFCCEGQKKYVEEAQEKAEEQLGRIDIRAWPLKPSYCMWVRSLTLSMIRTEACWSLFKGYILRIESLKV